MSLEPFLSVIIPYAGGSLAIPLGGLRAQGLDPDRFELILVEDGEHGAEGLLRRFALEFEVRVLVYRRDGFTGHSAGPMRNLGAGVARGSVLVFLDSDCLLSRDCLRRHLELASAGGETVICGGMRELPVIRQHLLERASYEELSRASVPDPRSLGHEPSRERPAHWEDFYSGNASVPGSLFRRVGGFDESGHRCHDMDLGYRLALAGARFVYAPDCEVLHVEHPRVAATRVEQARGWRHLAEKHPELSGFAEDRIVVLRRSYEREIVESEERFRETVRGLPGQRFGRTWTVPPGMDEREVRAALTVPSFRVERRDNAELYLRLHRNCWDYSVLVPNGEVTGSPRVSVVIPAWNGGRSIAGALASIFVQTLQSFEVLVIDDGSSDETLAELARFPADGRLRILSSDTNRGLSWALNAGLQAARAPCLVHLDADDWLEPNALERICARLEADPALGAVYSSPRLHQGDRVWRVEGRQAADGWELLVYKGVQSPRAYRVEVLRRLGGWSARDPFEGRFFEDRLMLSRVARVAPVAYLPEILGNVRVLADSLSRRTPMRAAVAKLWILWLEANAAQRSLSVQLRGAFLRGRLTPRRRRPPERSWSVIIPVHDGAARLRRSLRSWMESDWSEVDGEILVVDDGSGEAIEEALAQGDPRIRLVRNAESRGAAWARNQGARLARGEMLFFSDSDHIVQPDVLSVHEHRHAEAGDTALVVGNVLGQRVFTDVEPARLPVSRLRQLLDLLENDPRLEHAAASIAMRRDFSLLDPGQVGMWRAAQAGAGADSWLWRWAPLILRFGETLAGYPHRWMRVSAGSLSVPARMFWDLGGFDEAMRSLEDWDLGARAQRSGATVICAPDAEPLHQVHPRDPRRQQENRKSARILRSKHPGLVRSALRSSGELRPPGADLLAPGTEDGPPEDRAPAGDGAGGFFAVTFDDGPHPFGTPLILEVLERYGAPATFFLLGREISRHRELCQRMVESGHEIGLHGWVHTPTTELTTREIAAGLARSAARLEEATGRRPAFARPPYGIATGSFLRAARSLGIQVASWHTSPRDWSSPGRIEMMKRLALAAVAGKVLLFHDGSGNPQDTADVVDWLLQAGRRFALQPLTLSAFAERAPLPPFADAPPQSDWPPPQV